jgi:hypothetical protein
LSGGSARFGIEPVPPAAQPEAESRAQSARSSRAPTSTAALNDLLRDARTRAHNAQSLHSVALFLNSL